jgi:hypothetical protein
MTMVIERGDSPIIHFPQNRPKIESYAVTEASKKEVKEKHPKEIFPWV